MNLQIGLKMITNKYSLQSAFVKEYWPEKGSCHWHSFLLKLEYLLGDLSFVTSMPASCFHRSLVSKILLLFFIVQPLHYQKLLTICQYLRRNNNMGTCFHENSSCKCYTQQSWKDEWKILLFYPHFYICADSQLCVYTPNIWA